MEICRPHITRTVEITTLDKKNVSLAHSVLLCNLTTTISQCACVHLYAQITVPIQRSGRQTHAQWGVTLQAALKIPLI